MTGLWTRLAVGTALCGIMAGFGCVLREETIRIASDGAVTIELEISGKEEQLARDDAMPSAESGWDVARRIEQDKDEEKLVLTSTRRFAPGEPLPDSFAAPADPDADLYLQFPTTVRIEDRSDGRYFFFRRLYVPRRWAYVQYWHDVFFDDDIKKLGDKPVEALTDADRRKIVQAFASSEAYKHLEFARNALTTVQPDLPMEHRLPARQTWLDVYETYGLLASSNRLQIFEDELDSLIERCESLSEGERGRCYDDQAGRILNEARTAFLEALHRRARIDPLTLLSLERAMDREKRYYDVTSALGGHHFGIEVHLPGTIIAHNGDEAAVGEGDRAGMSAVRWEFNGNAFRDRPHELLAVSRLVAKPDRPDRSPVNADDR